MNNKILLIIISCVFVVIIGSVAMAAPIVLRYADTATPGTPDYEGGVLFCKLVEERTNGNVKIEYYHSGQLGSDKAITEAAISGTVDIAKCSGGNFSDFSKALYFTDLPGLFKSHAHLVRVWLSPIRDEIFNQIKNDTGLHVLMFDIDAGAPRALGNKKKAVYIPDDAKGLKIRTTGSPVEIALFESWGVQAIPIAWDELYGAIQQGVVDGHYNQAEHTYYVKKFHELIKYFTITNQSWVSSVKAMGPTGVKKLGGVDSEYYNIVMKTAQEVELYKNILCSSVNAAATKGIEEAGVEVIRPNEEQMELWKQKSQSIWEDLVGPDKDISFDLVERIQALAD